MRPLAILATAAAAAALAGLSVFPYTATRDDDARLQLSWRLVGERVEACRELREEELERLPVHMRRAQECERRVLPYRLTLEIDGRTVSQRRIEPAGSRRDGPVFVYQDLPLRPGAYDVSVHFEPILPEGAEPEQELAAYQLHGAVQLGPREVGLVTYDYDSRRLVLRGAGGEAASR